MLGFLDNRSYVSISEAIKSQVPLPICGQFAYVFCGYKVEFQSEAEALRIAGDNESLRTFANYDSAFHCRIYRIQLCRK